MDKEKLNRQLGRAVEDEDVEKLNDALDKGADIECRYMGGCTPLILAAYEGHKGVVELLIKRNANVNAVETESNWTALIYAIAYDHKEIAELLLPLSGGLEGLKNQMKEILKGEKGPERLKVKIRMSNLYRKILSWTSKETQLRDVKTLKISSKKPGERFRTIKRRAIT